MQSSRKSFQTKGHPKGDAELETASSGGWPEEFQDAKQPEILPDKGVIRREMRNWKQHRVEADRKNFRMRSSRKSFQTKGHPKGDTELETASSGGWPEEFQDAEQPEILPDKGPSEGRCGTKNGGEYEERR